MNRGFCISPHSTRGEHNEIQLFLAKISTVFFTKYQHLWVNLCFRELWRMEDKSKYFVGSAKYYGSRTLYINSNGWRRSSWRRCEHSSRLSLGQPSVFMTEAWTVLQSESYGYIRCIRRTGKSHIVSADDVSAIILGCRFGALCDTRIEGSGTR